MTDITDVKNHIYWLWRVIMATVVASCGAYLALRATDDRILDRITRNETDLQLQFRKIDVKLAEIQTTLCQIQKDKSGDK